MNTSETPIRAEETYRLTGVMFSRQIIHTLAHDFDQKHINAPAARREAAIGAAANVYVNGADER